MFQFFGCIFSFVTGWGVFGANCIMQFDWFEKMCRIKLIWNFFDSDDVISRTLLCILFLHSCMMCPLKCLLKKSWMSNMFVFPLLTNINYVNDSRVFRIYNLLGCENYFKTNNGLWSYYFISFLFFFCTT